VIGTRNERSLTILKDVHAAPLATGTPLLVTDLETAELVKTAANAFLATKISFINAMSEMCEATGADVRDSLMRSVTTPASAGSSSAPVSVSVVAVSPRTSARPCTRRGARPLRHPDFPHRG
jgi:hypothetical protein